MDYEALFKSKRTALQFSGGKDSLALLSLMRPYLQDITVYWTNAGDPFPETLESVAWAKSIAPHFVEITGRRALVEKAYGWSTDLVTAGSTEGGHVAGDTDPMLIDRYSCCFRSMMLPMYERMKQDRVEVILRGQKKSDTHKTREGSGTISEGVLVLYPLEDWDDEMVLNHLNIHQVPIPRFYGDGMTSGGDCMTCTGWLEHNQVQYLKKHHPEAAKIVSFRLNEIKRFVDKSYELLAQAVE